MEKSLNNFYNLAIFYQIGRNLIIYIYIYICMCVCVYIKILQNKFDPLRYFTCVSLVILTVRKNANF